MTRHVFAVVVVHALVTACAWAQTAQSTGTSGAPGTSQSSPRTAQGPAGASVDDSTLHRQVHEQLATNPDLAKVKVRVQKGVVFLNGTIAKGEDRQAAKDLAMSVPGVKGVEDKLTISASAQPSPAPPTPNTTQGAGGQNPGGGTAGTTSATPTTQSPSSGSIGGPTSAAPPAGGTAAEKPSTAGSLGTAVSSSDLKLQIDSAIHNEPTLANSNLIVNVTDDTIELKGLLPSSRDRETALRIARSYAGNRRVIDRLRTNASTTGRTNQAPSGTTSQPSTNPDTGNAPTPTPKPH